MNTLENRILTGIKDTGYKGVLSTREELLKAIDVGPKNVEFTKFINYLTNEIRPLLGIDEEVNPIVAPEDSVSFIMELTSFLKELGCPYSSLLEGHVSERLQSPTDRLLVLDYLISELSAARILHELKPEKKLELKLQESPEAADMRKILMTLRFPKPPPNISLEIIFNKLKDTINIIFKQAGTALIDNPMFIGTLSDKQWETLNSVQRDLNNEYKIRREMLLTRLDVTIQSFQWSDKTKGKDALIENAYTKKRVDLKVQPDVELADLLAARSDLAIIEKTSSSSVRKFTKTSLNKVIIGKVPDRGGRTTEIAPPPPEMPSWQQRVAGPSGGGARGGRGRGGGGGSYNRGGGGNRGDYNNQNSNYKSYDSAGSYTVETHYNQNRQNFGGNRNNYNQYESNYGQHDSYGSNYDSQSGYGRRDSYSEQNSKRAKTYDSFQANKTTYADQYVQETEHNRQYQGRGRGGRGGGGRGRSSYNRGGHNYR